MKAGQGRSAGRLVQVVGQADMMRVERGDSEKWSDSEVWLSRFANGPKVRSQEESGGLQGFRPEHLGKRPPLGCLRSRFRVCFTVVPTRHT